MKRPRLTGWLAWLRRQIGFGRSTQHHVPDPPGQTSLDRAREMRLLLVEDDWRTHSTLRKIFTRLGWEVDSAVTVAGAVERLAARPEAMILDLMLADGVGLEVLRHVRSRRIAVRVVVTTGSADPALHAEVARLQPDAIIVKPVDLDDLLAALRAPGKHP